MKRTILVSLALAAAMFHVPSAEAQVSSGRNPWCLRDGPLGYGTWDCTYHNFQQCNFSSVYGSDGSCVPNPNYRGGRQNKNSRQQQKVRGAGEVTVNPGLRAKKSNAGAQRGSDGTNGMLTFSQTPEVIPMALKATLDIPQATGRDGAIDHVAKMQDGGTSHEPGRLLDSGERGDWYLVKDSEGVCVIHIPDLSTGKACRRLSVADILVAGGAEREELLRLIGTLVDQK